MLRRSISRRTTLKGIGTAIALPLLEAMEPRRLLGAQESAAAVRLAFLYAPNGKHMPDWLPHTEGYDYELPRTLQPLAGLKADFCVLSGLSHKKAEANGDGGGDHARALTTFLTGTQAKKTDGANIRAGISVDQVAARHLGQWTRLPSLEMGADAGAQSGNCDSGYSCAYSSNIAWMTETQPLAKEVSPALIFDRLFGSGRPGETAAAGQRRLRYSQSILDLASDDARRLYHRLGQSDKRKLDQYLTAVRELELRIAKAGSAPPVDQLPMSRPAGIPADYAEHLRLLADLLVLAFQTDSTRVASLVLANEGSNRSYGFLDIPEGHHDLSHHEGKAEKQAKIQKINQFHVTQLAYFLQRLKEVPERGGTLLDNCLIVYGSGIADGNAHAHNNLPILLAGSGAGAVRPGRHLAYPDGTPLTNLYLSMLGIIGISVDRLGDSTHALSDLA
ncbi:MAG: DUF1552 domain-containing protein [Pirellulaceae bacterium]|nr:DUF1552 domain-containing protein [Pirellulaceae bacterium]